MKRVQFDRYGSADAMRVGKYEVRQPKRGQVLVRVKAAAINPLDWKQRQGAMRLFMDKQFPKGMGSDFAGVVEAVGEGVDTFHVGDEVLGTMDVKRPGAFAEALVTASTNLVRKPSQLSFQEAACLPIPCATAWAAVLLKGQVSSRKRVLINGCTGAVGAMAAQLAMANGAQVAGTCSRTSMERARKAGLDRIFDYADPDSWSAEGPFDVIFDTAGTLPVGHGLSMLKPRGVFVDINPTPRRLLRGMLTRRYKLVFATMALQHLAEIAQLAAQGTLKPTIGLEKPFSDAVETITAVEHGLRTPGRVVLTF
ncbi:NAD(P)-dependent alcohol dehydrogenase [Ralstonia pseudosolanacearum]|uniref:NAD(P)-dependent alcohol dehydrogenase n=2 Tax=Ralstonia pseudosolanacearum TaxID=1310165 RepID=UPI001F4689C8|nr:NAD(P)-dependent alcohol dehydrogenase [Ralstonia pseudosolanacearum]MCF1440717.1 NAD(P)-dependent alcohol dehydrogenase [Ralstonia solanacearum]MDO3564366.1 NAD(P)-dependent alcohol dehydrogenase [Ralstonia pseudosolanacearum]MDO3574100.1 NAD(P)-dependent alcohol dehydrogenase [Ralstonia pseudosolanacearum]MDO3621398.1 NAD(P)-dependent alcohol dehydrogenase [Ralstonia pseudosolanacearum]